MLWVSKVHCADGRVPRFRVVERCSIPLESMCSTSTYNVIFAKTFNSSIGDSNNICWKPFYLI
jgi:hypothetical protein